MSSTQPTKETLWSKVSTKLLEVDKFPDTFQMPFAKGMVSLSSCTGIIATFLLVAAVGAFTFTTFSFVAFAGKSSTTDAVKEQAFKEDEIFGDEQGLNIAVGLSGAVT